MTINLLYIWNLWNSAAMKFVTYLLKLFERQRHMCVHGYTYTCRVPPSSALLPKCPQQQGLCGARPEPGAGITTQVPSGGGQDPVSQAILAASQCLHWKEASQEPEPGIEPDTWMLSTDILISRLDIWNLEVCFEHALSNIVYPEVT